MQTRIMYIENKDTGVARIGRVSFSPTRKTCEYNGHALARTRDYKANHRDLETGERYWISGCKRRGGDRLYSGVIEIDEDVREAYWTSVRQLPERKHERVIRDNGQYAR